MEILVTYDVSTEAPAGRSRLRRVAKVCQAQGQRVQKSVFECTVNSMELEVFLHKLLMIVELEEDSLRIYRLREPRGEHVQVFGKKPNFDLHDPLIV
ncbi:MAG: CRISPR-associated endonuclease Cas2 [Chloroflexi bacterium]|nr:CRISPR-associated endonuclease Cas2 [Chloroflexota bacterium]